MSCHGRPATRKDTPSRAHYESKLKSTEEKEDGYAQREGEVKRVIRGVAAAINVAVKRGRC